MPTGFHEGTSRYNTDDEISAPHSNFHKNSQTLATPDSEAEPAGNEANLSRGETERFRSEVEPSSSGEKLSSSEVKSSDSQNKPSDSGVEPVSSEPFLEVLETPVLSTSDQFFALNL